MTKIVTREFHVDDYAKSSYDVILVRYLLIELGLNFNFYKHIIEGGDGPFEASMAPMIDLGVYEFKYLNTGKITPI